ncbi:riboflavin aldehyde-forming enzyme [Pyricularia oryzae Y34]|uniref:Riboflavin aldehyde-forming enzyme n=2 Tax=Pyricularia oryzae TaxID=318829 RepID=A0AA97NSV1_PYRO3|nr:riboflavin aldehyde-forming enzyme [Pyricularia oryzae Y34]
MAAAGPEETSTNPRAPEPTLEWETRTPRPSRLSRFMPGGGASQAHHQQQHHDPERAPEAALAHKEAGQPQPGAKRSHHGNRLDRILPPHRKYLGMRRRVFLIALAAAAVALLILIVGLAAGLSSRSGGGEKMPLPEDGGTHEGELTYYSPGLGACGQNHDDEAMVVAVAHELFDEAGGGDANPNNNRLCGRKIRVSADGGGGAIEVEVVDRCEGCRPTDLDLSPAAFRRLADESRGRVKGEWQWV